MTQSFYATEESSSVWSDRELSPRPLKWKDAVDFLSQCAPFIDKDDEEKEDTFDYTLRRAPGRPKAVAVDVRGMVMTEGMGKVGWKLARLTDLNRKNGLARGEGCCFTTRRKDKSHRNRLPMTWIKETRYNRLCAV